MSSIIVALPKIEDAKKIRGILRKHGLEVSAVCTSGAGALQEAQNAGESGIVISSCTLSDMHYTQLVEYLPPSYELMLIGSARALAANDVRDVIAVEMPLKVADLINTVGMMLIQQEQKLRKKKRSRKVRDEKEENYINNAKYILMERNHMDEAEAYRYIQKSSMDSGTNMVETAQMILMLLYDEI